MSAEIKKQRDAEQAEKAKKEAPSRREVKDETEKLAAQSVAFFYTMMSYLTRSLPGNTINPAAFMTHLIAVANTTFGTTLTKEGFKDAIKQIAGNTKAT